MPCFKSPVLLTLALLSALGPHLASPALAAEDPAARIPASIEVWVEGIPDGATHHVAKLRGAWTLYVDYLRLTQSVDAQAGRAATLLGPGVNDGDFESGGGGLNAYLAQSLSVVETSAAVPAARGKKFLAMVADPTVDRHFPRVIKVLGMPNLSRGRCAGWESRREGLGRHHRGGRVGRLQEHEQCAIPGVLRRVRLHSRGHVAALGAIEQLPAVERVQPGNRAWLQRAGTGEGIRAGLRPAGALSRCAAAARRCGCELFRPLQGGKWARVARDA